MSIADRPRAALFDIDGTLVDSNYLHVDAWQRALAELGAPVDAWRIHRAIGQDSARLIRSLAGERGEGWIERAKQLHSAHYRDVAGRRLRTFDRTVELLRSVAGRGIRVVLATSAPGDELKLLLETLDAGEAVFATTSADDVDAAKPDPDLIEVGLNRADARPDEAVLLGDSTWDMIAAGRAGVAAFGLRCGGFPDAALRDAGARAIFDDPAQLLDHVDEVFGDE
jgi:phosphoglycolate phosphatase-like HAD superfamily hydrolase